MIGRLKDTMPPEGVSWQQGGVGHRDGCSVPIELAEPARRIGPSLVASLCETAKRANQPVVR